MFRSSFSFQRKDNRAAEGESGRIDAYSAAAPKRAASSPVLPFPHPKQRIGRIEFFSDERPSERGPLTVDWLLASLAWGLSSWWVSSALFRHSLGAHSGNTQPAYLAAVQLSALLLFGTLTVLCAQLAGSYASSSELWLVQKKSYLVVAVVVAATVVAVLSPMPMGLYTAALAILLTLCSLLAWRKALLLICSRRVRAGDAHRRVLIIGDENVTAAVTYYFESNPQLGYEVAGTLNEGGAGPHALGTLQDLHKIARTHFIDEVLIASAPDGSVPLEVVSECLRLELNVRIIADYSGCNRHKHKYSTPSGPLRLLTVESNRHNQALLVIKRALDIVASSVGFLILLPLFTVVAVLIKLDSPGPVFYRSWRVGRKGKLFTCYKFRSMREDANAQKEELNALNYRGGPIFKIDGDPRVTRLGRFLRKYSIDEMPQLINVLKGDMSLVGPRPHPVDDVERYQLEHLRRINVTPGLTGLWQVYARREASFEKCMELDLKYMREWSLWLDLRILIKTIPAVIFGTGQ